MKNIVNLNELTEDDFSLSSSSSPPLLFCTNFFKAITFTCCWPHARECTLLSVIQSTAITTMGKNIVDKVNEYH